MTIYRDKRMPKREVSFNHIELLGHRAITAKICYTVRTKDRNTWVTQPIEFTFCDARNLARRFHKFAEELEKMAVEFKRDLHGGNDQ